jgi:hypothetical protein
MGPRSNDRGRSAILNYSDFKDLNACSRAPTLRDWLQHSLATNDITQLTHIQQQITRERFQGFRRHPTAPDTLTCDEHWILSNLPIQHTRQQPSLNLEQSPVGYTRLEKRMGYQSVHTQFISPKESLPPASR